VTTDDEILAMVEGGGVAVDEVLDAPDLSR